MSDAIKLPGEWLVVGCNSLVGSRFLELVDTSNIYGAGGSDPALSNLAGFFKLDITNPEEVEYSVSKFPGKYIINFAGATAVDEIEKSRPEDIQNLEELKSNNAYRINVLGVKNLIQASKKYNKFPIFISTGFVYSGENGPYKEDDSIVTDPNEVGWYAWTKILAEKEVEESGISALVLRIDYPYRKEFSGKLDFARNFLKLYDDVKSGVKTKFYPIFTDQTLAPTFIDDLPKAVLTLVENNSTGVINVTSPEVVTPYQFCIELLKVARGVSSPEEIVPKGSLEDFQKAHPEMSKRGVHGGILPGKIIKLGFTPTSWKEGIQKAFGNNDH